MNIKDYYSKISAAYLEKSDSTTQVWPELTPWLLNQVPAKSAVLDAGCGPGIESRLLQKEGHLVTGCDLSPGMVEIYRKNLPGVRCEESNLCSLPFLDQEFDVVLAMFCFLHLSADEGAQAISEIARVLKPGGLFFLATPFGDGSMIFRRHRVAAGLEVGDIPFHWWSEREMNSLLADHGFELRDRLDRKKYEHIPPLTCLTSRKTDPAIGAAVLERKDDSSR